MSAGHPDIRFNEYPPKQDYPPQQEYPHQQGPPLQQVYPPAYTVNQQMCTAPVTTVIGREGQVQPNDYLAFSVFILVCCCLPLGIVALIKSTKVGPRFRAGDYNGALESSKAAKRYAMNGLWCGIAIDLVCVLLLILRTIADG